MASRWGLPGGGGSPGGSPSGEGLMPHERGSRRKKLAAMAGSVYRAGVAAATELRDTYSQTRALGDGPEFQMTIPGSFPNASIVVKGDDQMVLFPSYAKRHIKQTRDKDGAPAHPHTAAHMNMNDEEYWRHEWAKMEDKNAIVDIDVRGWVYSPHKGPMTRRNRILVGLARKLSGIPAPGAQDQTDPNLSALNEDHERLRDQSKIAREAEEIERKGQGEKEVANRGGYSEAPKEEDSDSESFHHSRSRSGSRTPLSAPSSPVLSGRSSWTNATDLTEAELAVANANLMARVAPFMTTPLSQLPITLFFYNDKQSQSRTVITNDAGHFVMRAALDFVPTHVRVLANENLSATTEIEVIEQTGISMISDIDDTIKRSNIALGAREIFRNTFIRDLGDLTIDGVKEWYTSLHEMGVRIHYCSNSPWQLFPMLASYFHIAELPSGSIHLKQYNGMLQGIFEPVAERKKGTLDKILRDFPERKFILVGDSGEADLEVYTELVVANPGRILAVFIRDVTTPEQAGYFDGGYDPNNGRRSKVPSFRSKQNSGEQFSDEPASRPTLPPRIQTEPPSLSSQGPSMGTLIDLSDEPEEMSLCESQQLNKLKQQVSALDLLGRNPPPRPAKPASLRGQPSELSVSGASGLGITSSSPAAVKPQAREHSGPHSQPISHPHPLAQMQNSSDPSFRTGSSSSGSRRSRDRDPAGGGPTSAPTNTSASTTKPTPPVLPPRRRGTPSSFLSLSPRLLAHRSISSNGDIPLDTDTTLPAPATISGATVTAGAGSFSSMHSLSLSMPGSPTLSGASTPNTGAPGSPGPGKKVEMWRRRLARAHETLEQHGVRLYTWRRGEDVVAEAQGVVKEAMREQEAMREWKAGRRREPPTPRGRFAGR